MAVVMNITIYKTKHHIKLIYDICGLLRRLLTNKLAKAPISKSTEMFCFNLYTHIWVYVSNMFIASVCFIPNMKFHIQYFTSHSHLIIIKKWLFIEPNLNIYHTSSKHLFCWGTTCSACCGGNLPHCKNHVYIFVISTTQIMAMYLHWYCTIWAL